MRLFLLSGESRYNKIWIDFIADKLKSEFPDQRIQYYDHWNKENQRIDFDHEYRKFVDSAGKEENLIVFAKSIGTIIALKAICEKKTNPVKCVFVGAALSPAINNSLGAYNWIRNYSVPTLFIQQTKDPVLSFEKLKKLLEEFNASNFKLLETPGDNHHYDNLEEIKKAVIDFVYNRS